MILGKGAILGRLRDSNPERRLTISPILEPEQVGRCSVDIRLGNEFLLVNRETGIMGIDPIRRGEMAESVRRYQTRVEVAYGSPFYLHPQQFSLARTFEYLALPSDIAGYVLGRSSWGRLGLVIATATVVECGFKGVLVLELANLGSVPIVLYPGMRIAQLVLHSVDAGTNIPVSPATP